MEKIDVLVIGQSCVDIISVVEQFPREDTKIPLLYRMIEGGGQGGTASCCIARLGGKVAREYARYDGCSRRLQVSRIQGEAIKEELLHSTSIILESSTHFERKAGSWEEKWKRLPSI